MPGFAVIGVRPGVIESRARARVKYQEQQLKTALKPGSHERRLETALKSLRKAPPESFSPTSTTTRGLPATGATWPPARASSTCRSCTSRTTSAGAGVRWR